MERWIQILVTLVLINIAIDAGRLIVGILVVDKLQTQVEQLSYVAPGEFGGPPRRPCNGPRCK